MNRVPALLVLAAAAAVGAVLLLLLSGGNPAAPRTTPVEIPGVGAVTGPEARATSPGSMDAAPGSTETRADRILDLLSEITSPAASPDQRTARSRELDQLVKSPGYRVTPAVRERLLAMLATAEPRWRGTVADAIGGLRGDAETARALVAMLEASGEDIQVRDAILSALASMQVRYVLPALLSMIGKDLADEPAVIATVGALAGPTELEGLLALLGKPLRPVSRREIERVLAARGGAEGILDRVVDRLEDAGPEERRSLLRILAASTGPAHAARLRAILGRETDPECRGILIPALGAAGDLESGRELSRLAREGTPAERRLATQAIRGVRNPETVEAFVADWRQLDDEGRAAVMDAVAGIPEPSEPMVARARGEGLADPEPRVRTAAARVLGRPGRDDNVEPLAAFLRRSALPVEIGAALTALERIGTKAAARAAILGLDAVPSERQRERWRQRFEGILKGSP